jgi:hypothetical protein
MDQLQPLSINFTYQSCRSYNTWYNSRLADTVNSCDDYQTIDLVANTPTRITDGFDLDPIIVNFRCNGTNIELCYSFYELRSSGSACVYSCYYGSINTRFNYYYHACNDVSACVTTQKYMNVHYTYGSIDESDGRKHNSTYNSAHSKRVHYLLLLFLISFLFIVFWKD